MDFTPTLTLITVYRRASALFMNVFIEINTESLFSASASVGYLNSDRTVFIFAYDNAKGDFPN